MLDKSRLLTDEEIQRIANQVFYKKKQGDMAFAKTIRDAQFAKDLAFEQQRVERIFKSRNKESRLLTDEEIIETGIGLPSPEGLANTYTQALNLEAGRRVAKAQDAKTASIKDKRIRELEAINESHRALNANLREELKNKDTEC